MKQGDVVYTLQEHPVLGTTIPAYSVGRVVAVHRDHVGVRFTSTTPVILPPRLLSETPQAGDTLVLKRDLYWCDIGHDDPDVMGLRLASVGAVFEFVQCRSQSDALIFEMVNTVTGEYYWMNPEWFR